MSVLDNSAQKEQNNEIQDVIRKLDILVEANNQVAFTELRGRDIYTQRQYIGKFFPESEVKDLCDAYAKMEKAKAENDVLTYALYCYKQTEAIINKFLNQVTPKEAFDDMNERIGNTGYFLIHKVFSNATNDKFIGFNFEKQIVEKFLAKKELPAVSDFTYQQGLRYFIWYFDNKLGKRAGGTVSKINDNFVFIDNPYYYLSTARNTIHGGQKKPPTVKEVQRLNEINSCKGKFFELFQHLLYEIHKRFFTYESL